MFESIDFKKTNDTGTNAPSGFVTAFVSSSGAFSIADSDGNISTLPAVSSARTNLVPYFAASAQTTPAPTAAIILTNYLSTLDSTAGATTQTLAASTIVGQVKKITMIVDGGDDVVTVTSLTGGTTITFSNVGDTVELMWNGTAWIVLARYNQATGAATTPVIA